MDNLYNNATKISTVVVNVDMVDSQKLYPYPCHMSFDRYQVHSTKNAPGFASA